jgi:hypothetical protein
MAFVNLNQSTCKRRFVPTGSLITSHSKFGHELIAGPVVGGRQVVGHSEPAGNHVEWMDSAAQRYPFAQVLPPVNDQHGAVAWEGMVQQLDNPWAVLDNCQHKARRAYYGLPSSPFVDGVLIAGGFVFLLWAVGRH